MKHLSRFDIEAIAVKYVQAYMALPDVRNTQIYRIDPELLLEKVLGLNVEYQHLSYDGSILGMTSFTEMGVQVFEDDDNEAFFFLDGKTVLVEKDLNFDSKLKGRKNFTLMHEGSHQIFNMLFPNDYGVTQKSAGVHYYKANSERNKPISDWEEWQANTLGAAILLPENLIKQGMYISVEEASGYTGLGRDTIYSLTQEDDCDFVLKVGHRTMIKRKKFENYLENLSSI